MPSVSSESCRWSIAAHNPDGAARAPDGDAQLPLERPGARRDGALLDVGRGPGEQPHLPPRVLPHQQEAGHAQLFEVSCSTSIDSVALYGLQNEVK